MTERVPSSPHFFRKIKLSMALFALALAFIALFWQAPLEPPADRGNVPNPSKAAWFLLWIQELVSYSTRFIYGVAALGLYFLLIPSIHGRRGAERARWLPGDQAVLNVVTITAFLAITALTCTAYFFRGENWRFVWPL
jgi:hypothetical protein